MVLLTQFTSLGSGSDRAGSGAEVSIHLLKTDVLGRARMSRGIAKPSLMPFNPEVLQDKHSRFFNMALKSKTLPHEIQKRKCARGNF
jgi:hypothetical protein